MEETKYSRMPMLGEIAPSFQAKTTQGDINFPSDYKGRWVVLFSHPADFTPVCTTEFMTFANMMNEFDQLNTQLVGLSVDSNSSHIAWLKKIEEFDWNGIKNIQVMFPLIDDSKMEVAEKYGMIHPKQSTTDTVRAVFIIDPQGIIRTILYYPLTTGRNMHEIIRIIQALQKADSDKVATPANWQPGQDTVLPAPKTMEMAEERLNNQNGQYYCLDWFLCFKKEQDMKMSSNMFPNYYNDYTNPFPFNYHEYNNPVLYQDTAEMYHESSDYNDPNSLNYGKGNDLNNKIGIRF